MVTIVKHPETGDVLTQSKSNPLVWNLRVDAKTPVQENGFFRIQHRSAFIKGSKEDLELYPTIGNKPLADGVKVEGKIIRLTSETPFYASQQIVLNPRTNEPALNKNGKVYYQNFVHTFDETAKDEEISSTKSTVIEHVEADLEA